jgi:uncharacterized protein (TIGR02453 family)
VSGFGGFPREGVRFLADLREHNEREWFTANRDRYQSALLEPARDLVEAIGAEVARAGIDANADPRVGGSIFRINRDTRFSKDKRPYKDHLDLWFWQGPGPSRSRPGYFFRLTPEALFLGAGMHDFEPPLLERYRAAVADERRGAALAKAVAQVERAGYEVGGRGYKRVPAGYDVPDDRAPLLLHRGLYAGIELPHPGELHTPKLPRFCVSHFRKLRPLQDAVVELVDG